MVNSRFVSKLFVALVAIIMPFGACRNALAQAGPWVQTNLAAKSLYLSGDYEGAEKTWLEALEMARQIAPGDPRVAETLSELGLLYERTGRFEESATMFRSAILIKQNIYGENSPEIKEDLFSYANALKQIGEEPDAIEIVQRAAKIAAPDNKAMGASDDTEEPTTPTNKSVDAWLEKTRSAIGGHHMLSAQVYALAALKQRNHDGGSEAEPVAMIGDVIHRLLHEGNPRSAELLADRALSEVQDYRGFQHTEVAYMLSLRASALHALGEDAAAGEDMSKANRIYVRVAEEPMAPAFRPRPILNTNALARFNFDAGRAGGPFYLMSPKAYKSTYAVIRNPDRGWDDFPALDGSYSKQLANDEEEAYQRIREQENIELKNLRDRERAAESASVYSHYIQFTRIRNR